MPIFNFNLNWSLLRSGTFTPFLDILCLFDFEFMSSWGQGKTDRHGM